MWEYKVRNYEPYLEVKSYEQWLDRYGKDGWELVAQERRTDDPYIKYSVTFKRPLTTTT